MHQMDHHFLTSKWSCFVYLGQGLDRQESYFHRTCRLPGGAVLGSHDCQTNGWHKFVPCSSLFTFLSFGGGLMCWYFATMNE